MGDEVGSDQQTKQGETERGAPPKEIVTKPLEEGIERVKRLLGPNDQLGSRELIPDGKKIIGVNQENFQWSPLNRYYDGPGDKNPNDGEVYTIKFEDGSASYFTHSKVPVGMWEAIMLNPDAVSAGVRVHKWSLNNRAMWNGKDKLELVIPVARPNAEGEVVDRYTATFDGTKTNMAISRANGARENQMFDGDQTKPELILDEWRTLVMKDGRPLNTINYSNTPPAAPAFPSPQ